MAYEIQIPSIVVEPPRFIEVTDEVPVRRAAQSLLRIARHGGSLFLEHDIWTRENLDVLIERFVRQPDVSGRSFFEKLESQLEGVSRDVRFLFAEILVLQMLPIAQFRPDTKVEIIEQALGDGAESVNIPVEILAAFESPVFGGGVAFAIRRFNQLAVLIEFFRHLKSLSSDEVNQAFEDPIAWRSAVNESPGTPEPSIRASLTYLGHPDFYLPIVSLAHKKAIVDGFYPEVTRVAATGDLDADLYGLRLWLAGNEGPTPDFYQPPLVEYWGRDAPVDPDPAPEPVLEPDAYTVESIVEEGAFHAPESLRRIIERWEETRNVILQGAPGTGKTWLARRLAFALIGREVGEAVRSVQFHPGTSYEDFVRGWRPAADGRLELVDGPMLQHARRAAEHPDIPHVLIIEEFNRGNPAHALGEMLTLIERTKRTEADALELTYMREDEPPFFLPDNLFIIGTMNTADRSLALVDFALRRRFAFFDLTPQLGDAWRRHLEHRFRNAKKGEIALIGRRVTGLNAIIAEDPSLGASFELGHAFFTPGREVADLVPWFRGVVESSVRPQLMEYWPEDPDRVASAAASLLEDL